MISRLNMSVVSKSTSCPDRNASVLLSSSTCAGRSTTGQQDRISGAHTFPTNRAPGAGRGSQPGLEPRAGTCQLGSMPTGRSVWLVQCPQDVTLIPLERPEVRVPLSVHPSQKCNEGNQDLVGPTGCRGHSHILTEAVYTERIVRSFNSAIRRQTAQ